MKIKKITLINIVILLTFVLVGCDSSTESEIQPIDIVGIWDVTEIEGSGRSVDSSNSIWAFEADGTYEWFLLFKLFDLQGQGTYSLDGNALMIEGFVTNVFGKAPLNLTFSNDNNTFSLSDTDGVRWTYNRRVE